MADNLIEHYQKIGRNSILFPGDVRHFIERFAEIKGDIDFKNEDHLTELNRVLSDIKDIWEEEGFLPPWELQEKLLERNLNSNSKFHDLSKAICAEMYEAEGLSGLLQGARKGEFIGLAHLYGQITKRDLALLSLDISNLKGTNNLSKNNVAAALGKAPKDLTEEEYFKYTDKYVRLLLKEIQKTIKDEYPDCTIQGVRTGGDEFEFVVEGIPPEEFKKLEKKLQKTINQRTAQLDLHDHKHARYEDDPDKKGLGAGLTFTNFKKLRKPKKFLRRIEKRIKESGKAAGKDRYRHSEDFEKAKSISRTRSSEFNLREQYSESLDWHEYILHHMLKFFEHCVPDLALKRPDNIDIDRRKVQGAGPYASAKTRAFKAIENHLDDSNITLTNYEEIILERLKDSFEALDPATGLLSQSALPEMAGYYLQDTPEDEAFQGFLLEMENLGGVNDLVGHDIADGLFQYLANIIIAELSEIGLFDGENCDLAQIGGAKFPALIQPTTDEKKQKLGTALEKIQACVEDLNNQNVIKFFRDHYDELNINPSAIEFRGTFGEIPKKGDKSKRPYGIHLNSSGILDLLSKNFKRGGQVISHLVNAKRKAYTPALILEREPTPS